MTLPDSQTPASGQVFLDHVGWFVPDIDAASEAFERLGFVLTDFVVSRNADLQSGALVPSGTGNRCAMLHRGYLELIASIDGVDTALARQHRDALSRYAGVHVIAFTVGDAAAAHGRLLREGFAPGAPVLLRRPVQAADGTDALAQFTVIRVPPEKMPEGRIQILTQETPELVWQERLITRDSQVAGLGGVLLCVEDPLRTADRYARFTGRPARWGNDYAIVELDRGRLGFGTVPRCRALLHGEVPLVPSIAAVALWSSSLDVTRGFLASRGIATAFDEGAWLGVPGGRAGGTTVVIHEGSASWPPVP